jgi:hypothetical protein
MYPNTADRYAHDPRLAPANVLEELGVSRSEWRRMGQAARRRALERIALPSGNTLIPGATGGPHGSKGLMYMPYYEPMGFVRGGKRRTTRRRKIRRRN